MFKNIIVINNTNHILLFILSLTTFGYVEDLTLLKYYFKPRLIRSTKYLQNIQWFV